MPTDEFRSDSGILISSYHVNVTSNELRRQVKNNTYPPTMGMLGDIVLALGQNGLYCEWLIGFKMSPNCETYKLTINTRPNEV